MQKLHFLNPSSSSGQLWKGKNSRIQEFHFSGEKFSAYLHKECLFDGILFPWSWSTLQIYWLYSVQLFAVLRLPLSFGCTQSSWWLCTANGCNESEMQPNKAPIWIFVFGCSNIWPVRIELLKVICHTFYYMPYNLKY